MKKLGLFCVAALATFTLANLQTQKDHYSISNGDVVMAAQKNFSKQNYAVMAYLKYTKQDLNSVQDNSLDVDNDNGVFEIDNGSEENFIIKVGKSNITLKTTDQNGKKKSHTYTKSQLKKEFNGQQDKLNSIIENDDDQESSSSTNQVSQQSVPQQQSATQQSNAEDDSDSDDSDSDIDYADMAAFTQSEEAWWSNYIANGGNQ